MKSTFYTFAIFGTILLFTAACIPTRRLATNNNDAYAACPAQVTMKNKQIYTGYIVPVNIYSADFAITTKDKKTVTKLEQTEIDHLIFWNEAAPEHKYRFEYTKIYEAILFTLKTTLSSSEKWINVIEQTPQITAYYVGELYTVNNKGVLSVSQLDTPPSIHLLKKGETYPAYMGRIYHEDSNFRKRLLIYLADDPELCEYIKTKKLGPDNIVEIIKRYNPKK